MLNKKMLKLHKEKLVAFYSHTPLQLTKNVNQLSLVLKRCMFADFFLNRKKMGSKCNLKNCIP